MTLQGEQIKAIKQAIKDKYAWPGGYPLYFACNDGGALCITCGRDNLMEIVSDIARKTHMGWACTPTVNWEDGDLHCAHCNKLIESAYAD